MVVPAKVADQFGKGLVRSMPSKAVAGGIRGPMVGKGRIRGGASFVPVTEVVAAGGLAAAAGPLILMVLVVALGAYADQQQQQAIKELSALLRKLEQHNLDSERAELEGCHDAVESATALLLDGAKIGHSIGFGNAVGQVDKAVARARRRLTNWNATVANLPRTRDQRVEVHRLIDAFPGIDKGGGEFQAHLKLAAAAIALKRRVNLLQALEHTQLNPENRFERFTRRMAELEASVNELEAGIRAMPHDVASLDLTRPRRKLQDVMFTTDEMERYLSALQKVRALAAGVDHVETRPDVAIETVRERDGKVTVLPALPA
jgi:exonuclease VII small subunit